MIKRNTHISVSFVIILETKCHIKVKVFLIILFNNLCTVTHRQHFLRIIMHQKKMQINENRKFRFSLQYVAWRKSNLFYFWCFLVRDTVGMVHMVNHFIFVVCRMLNKDKIIYFVALYPLYQLSDIIFIFLCRKAK